MGEIQRADPRARRTAVVIVGCAAVVGVVLMMVARQFRPELETWLEQDLSARFRLVVAGLIIMTSGPVLGLAGYLWHVGRRIVRAERYPPADLPLTSDIRVVTGDTAVRRGRLIQLLGATLGLAALLLAFFLWRLVVLLRAEAA